MSTYASRPVFDFATNWATAPFVEDSAELNVIEIGKGAPRFQKTRTYTGSVYEFAMDLDTEAEIIAFEAFVAASMGRLNGFWIVYPQATLGILSRTNDTTYIVSGGLADYWTQEASAYLAFSKAGATTQYAKVSSVTDTGDNSETIVVDTALTGVDATWTVQRLIYARFATDDFSLDFDGDNVATTTLRVVELTLEYAAVETGQQPVYLYEFAFMSLPTPVYYRYAGFDVKIPISGNDFNAAAIEHSGLSNSIRRGDSETTITAVYETGSPLIRFLPFNMPGPLSIKIYERDYSDDDNPNTVTTIFTGRVTRVGMKGTRITAKCETILAVAGRTFPRFNIQPRCNYRVFSTYCRLVQANYKFTAKIYALGINNIEVEDVKDHHNAAVNELTAFTDDYFSFGWLEYGTGVDFQARTIAKAVIVPITSTTGRIKINMTMPLVGVVVDETPKYVTLYPGCDGAVATCKAKFSNFINFGGHVMAPANLSMAAVEQNLAQGANKK